MCYNYNYKRANKYWTWANHLTSAFYTAWSLTLLNWDWGFGPWALSPRILGKVYNLGLMSHRNPRWIQCKQSQTRISIYVGYLKKWIKDLGQKRFEKWGVSLNYRFRASKKKAGSGWISWVKNQILGIFCIHGSIMIIRRKVFKKRIKKNPHSKMRVLMIFALPTPKIVVWVKERRICESNFYI